MSNASLDTAKLERRIVRIALQWAKVGRGWLMNGDGQPTDLLLVERLEQAIADLNEAKRRK